MIVYLPLPLKGRGCLVCVETNPTKIGQAPRSLAVGTYLNCWQWLPKVLASPTPQSYRIHFLVKLNWSSPKKFGSWHLFELLAMATKSFGKPNSSVIPYTFSCQTLADELRSVIMCYLSQPSWHTFQHMNQWCG